MKKIFLYAAVGVFAFLISLGIVFFFAFRSSYNLETSKNVCQKCLDVSKTENLKIKTLVEIFNRKDFDGTKIRLEARFGHDAGYTFLHDLKDEKITVPVGFDKNTIPCADTEKTLQVCTGYKTWYDSSVEVTVVGYLGKIDKETNTFQGGEYGFNIICIEQVNATERELRNGKAKFEKNPFSIFGL